MEILGSTLILTFSIFVAGWAGVVAIYPVAIHLLSNIFVLKVPNKTRNIEIDVATMGSQVGNGAVNFKSFLFFKAEVNFDFVCSPEVIFKDGRYRGSGFSGELKRYTRRGSGCKSTNI
jgi:hypothetical protein